MKWFKHFSDARDGKKLSKLRMKYGVEGYGIYWYCLECVAGDLGSGKITFELKHDAEIIAFNLKMDTLKVEEIMRYMIDIDLFENSEGKITCLRLAKYLDKKVTRNKGIHQVIDSFNQLSQSVPDSAGQVETTGDKPENVPDVLKHFPLDEDEMRLDENIKPSSSDAPEKFAMHLEWAPDISQDQIKLLQHRGMTQSIYEDQLNAYRLVKIGGYGDKRSQHQWSQAFITTLNKHCTGLQCKKSGGQDAKFDAGAEIAGRLLRSQ